MAVEGGGDASATRKSRPLVMPDSFSGESSWDEWIGHFESVALVNEWDDAAKCLWVQVRLTGKAQTAWRRLSAEAKESYTGLTEALRKRFEPDSKRELYAAEFQARRRRRDESWGDFADDLRRLSDKAFPDLEEKAREKLALDRYLSEVGNPQVAFAVRQQRPKNLDDAVAHTLEMESYLVPSKPVKVAAVEQEASATIAAMQTQQEAIVEMLRSLSTRLEKIETRNPRSLEPRAPWREPGLTGNGPRRSQNGGNAPSDSGGTIVCRKCGQPGHFVRGCAAGYRRAQGNDRPSAP